MTIFVKSLFTAHRGSMAHCAIKRHMRVSIQPLEELEVGGILPEVGGRSLSF